MTNTLSDKIALVTGGSRGIGRDTALQLAARGADIVITYRERADAAEAVVAEIRATGRRATALQADLTGTAALPAFCAAFRAQLADWGRENFDILVPSAGTLRVAPFGSVTEADLDHLWQTNYLSVFMLTQTLAPSLADGGRIVLIGSGVATHVFGPLVAYGPLKAAIESLVPYLAQALGGRGITVNAVAPGGLDDDLNADLFDRLIPGARDLIRGATALGRVGLPGDVGGVIAFLCEPQAGFITGQVLGIDGGYKL